MITDLPVECFRGILDYLDPKSKVAFFSTCSLFRKIVWLDSKSLSPILIQAPSLIPFTLDSSLCQSFLQKDFYARKILNVRNFEICMKKIENASLPHLPRDIWLFYAHTHPEEAIAGARQLDDHYFRTDTLRQIATLVSAERLLELLPEIFETALKIEEQSNKDKQLSLLIKQTKDLNPKLALQYARHIETHITKIEAIVSLSKIFNTEALLKEALKVSKAIVDPCEKVRALCTIGVDYQEILTICDTQAMKEYVFKYIAEADPLMALSMIDQLQNKTVILCFIGKNLYYHNLVKAQEVMKQAYDSAKMTPLLFKKVQYLYTIGRIVLSWNPNWAKEILIEALILADDLTDDRDNPVTPDEIKTSICKRLATFDANETFRLALAHIGDTKFYSDIFLTIGIEHPYHRVRMFTKALACCNIYKSDEKFFEFVERTAPFDECRAIKTIDLIKSDEIKAKALFHVAKGIMHINPVKAILLADRATRIVQGFPVLKNLDCFLAFVR